MAIALGSEAAGLTDAFDVPEVVAVRLPMLGIADSLNVSVAAAVLFVRSPTPAGMMGRMDQFDIVIIGAGAAGEAAAFKARALGASVAVVERDLVGGSCAYWACIPSKSLLHSAAVHHGGGDYPWSAHRCAATT